jgi:hypothetical protein
MAIEINANGSEVIVNVPPVYEAGVTTPFAFVPHTHIIADVTGLQPALDAKANTVHTHSINNVTGLQPALDGKANTAHTHIIGDVTGLQTALDGKANTTHNHIIGDVTGLQPALDGKANATHTHALNALTGVSLPSPATNNLFGFDGTNWVARNTIDINSAVIRNTGSYDTPALTIGGTAIGMYIDTGRLFFRTANNFGGGFAAGQFIGNAIALQVEGGGTSTSPMLICNRLTVAGRAAGIGGGSGGDVTLLSNNTILLQAQWVGSQGNVTLPSLGFFCFNRLTTSQRDALSGVVSGVTIYNTTTNKLQCHNGTGWQDLF